MELGNMFLHGKNPHLHHSKEIETVVGYLRANGEKISNEPTAKIRAYLGLLAHRQYVNDGILTGDPESIARQVEAGVINTDNFPESYFELQKKIDYEKGYGLRDIPPDHRARLIEFIQADQRGSLAVWAEHLAASAYPVWFTYYAWTSLKKLAHDNGHKDGFKERSSSTTAPYPELNLVALACVYKEIESGMANKNNRDDFIAQANFAHMYDRALQEAKLQSAIAGGVWKKFNQTDNPDEARQLSDVLRGHSTRWCIAGEGTAFQVLQRGDFYIYLAPDDIGSPRVPRAVIGVEDGYVTEVCGLAPGQLLEPEMQQTVDEMLKNLPGAASFKRGQRDMCRVTHIYNKLSGDVRSKLEDDDLRLIYEMDYDVHNTVGVSDSRLHKLRVFRKGCDQLEIARLIPETIRSQLKSASHACQTVAEQLGSETALAALGDIEQLFNEKDRQWHKNGVYKYITQRFIYGSIRHDLVITPNAPADEMQIFNIALAFSQDIGGSMKAWRNFYKGSYADLQRDGEPLRISLIPNREGSGSQAIRGIKGLRKIQARYPAFGFRVPSMLETMAWWYALHAKGTDFRDFHAYNQTHISFPHLSLGEFGEVECAPHVYVSKNQVHLLGLEKAAVAGFHGLRIALG